MGARRRAIQESGSMESREEHDAWLCFALGLFVFWCAQWLHGGAPFVQSPWPYYVYYARALLDAQLHFGALPPSGLDLAVFEGRTYLYHPPFPALLMAPLVALGGLGVPDRLVAALLGAANGALFHGLLRALDRQGFARSTRHDRLLLSVLFLFGTVHFYLVVTANHWEISQVVCITGVLLAWRAAFAGRYALAALAFVAVLWTRSHVVLSSFGVLALFLSREGTANARRLAPAAAIGAAGVAGLMLFNAARFGDPFESGTSHQQMHGMFRAAFDAYGLFDLHYLPANLHALLIATPISWDAFPYFTFSTKGLSLFLATPFYLYLWRSLRRETRTQAVILWAGVLPPMLAVLTTIGTGEMQFGHRYSADLQPLLIPLAWLGAGMRFTRVGLVLLGASLAMSGYGAWWFVSRYAH
jgi:hypothetical protein